MMRIASWSLLLVLTGSAVAGAQADGAPLAVRTISFSGNRHLGDAELRAAIATRQASFLARAPVLGSFGLGSAPRFDADEFRRDVLRLRALYGARGFPDAQVDTVLSRSGNRVDIRVRIDEREPIRIDSLAITGAPPRVPLASMLEAIRLEEGAPFDRLAYANAEVLLRTRLRDAGYPWVVITSGFQLDSARGTARVRFTVDAGPRAVVGRIEIEGRIRTDERVIRRTMQVQPGQPYSEEKLYEDQVALYQTNLFSFVGLSLADTVRPEVTGDSAVTVRVTARVIEGTLRTGRVGAGYGTRDCFRGSARLEWLDFGGRGRRLDVNGRVSQVGTGEPLGGGLEHSLCPAMADEDPERLKLNYYTGFSLHDPLLSQRRLSATVSAFAERHTEINAYLRETVHGQLSVTREMTPTTDASASYALSYGRTLADPVTFCILLDVCQVSDTRTFERAILRSVLGLEVVRQTTASLLEPRRGTTALLGLHWAGGAIGADPLARFVRLDAEVAAWYPLGSTVLAMRVRGGVAAAPWIDGPNGRERFVPPEHRFYAGGPNSVRGFGQNQLGPLTYIVESVDTTGAVPDSSIRTSATGAEQLALFNVEWRFPLPFLAGLSGAVFTDAAWMGTQGAFTFSKLRATPGVGVRLATAIGPVGLDVAYNPYRATEGPLYRVDGSDFVLVRRDYRPRRGTLDRFRLNFSVGQAF